MLEGKHHYATDMVFPLDASFIARSVGFEASYDLTRLNEQLIDSSDRTVGDQREML